jgi:hypothetical protein
MPYNNRTGESKKILGTTVSSIVAAEKRTSMSCDLQIPKGPFHHLGIREYYFVRLGHAIFASAGQAFIPARDIRQ